MKTGAAPFKQASPGRHALPRRDHEEWLDLGLGSSDDVRANLQEMWRINRYLGGLAAFTRHLYPRLLAAQGSVTLADLGTGAAEIPLAIARWAHKRGRDVRVVALDWSARNLAVARQHVSGEASISLLQADARRLPLRPASVDYVVSSLFLHHFAEEFVIGLMRDAYATARHGIVMSDLVRGRLPLAAFRLIQPLFARNHLTRHDGAVSISRAYTPGELRQLADAAGLAHARITQHWPWRMTLVADKLAPPGGEPGR